MSDLKNKAWLIERLNKLRKSCSESAVPPDKGYYTAKAQAYKKAMELAELLNAPAVDAVEVVFCKDCIYQKDATVNCKGFIICPVSNMEITDDDYCSYGERRESEVSE